jgi:hypothetical protein
MNLSFDGLFGFDPPTSRLFGPALAVLTGRKGDGLFNVPASEI